MRKILPAAVSMGVVLGAALFGAAIADHPQTLADLAGAYSDRHPIHVFNGTGEDVSDVDDTLEIVRLSDSTAYVEISLTFTNGHQCELTGIADFAGGALVYRHSTTLYESAARPEVSALCELRIVRVGGKMVLEDRNGACRSDSCGARARYDGAEFSAASRRPVADIARIKSSEEFADAMREHNRR
jgi:hypothetical protein